MRIFDSLLDFLDTRRGAIAMGVAVGLCVGASLVSGHWGWLPAACAALGAAAVLTALFIWGLARRAAAQLVAAEPLEEPELRAAGDAAGDDGSGLGLGVGLRRASFRQLQDSYLWEWTTRELEAIGRRLEPGGRWPALTALREFAAAQPRDWEDRAGGALALVNWIMDTERARSHG